MTDQPRRDEDAEIRKERDRLAKDLEKMKRPDRAIPLPDDDRGDDTDDDGAGPVTGIVP